MDQELVMAMTRVLGLVQSGLLPRQLMVDLLLVMNTALESSKNKTPMGSTRWR
jgi:hypothetical protein